jgi:hypothetical protein
MDADGRSVPMQTWSGLVSMKGSPLKGVVWAWSLRRWDGPYMTTDGETEREREHGKK